MFVEASARATKKSQWHLRCNDNIIRVIVRPDIFLALAAETTPPPRAAVGSPLRPRPQGAGARRCATRGLNSIASLETGFSDLFYVVRTVFTVKD
jgi:hypothetical protein